MALKMNQKYEEGLNKYSFYDLVNMVGMKCLLQQHSKGGCSECEFLNEEDECNLSGMPEDASPDVWINQYTGGLEHERED